MLNALQDANGWFETQAAMIAVASSMASLQTCGPWRPCPEGALLGQGSRPEGASNFVCVPCRRAAGDGLELACSARLCWTCWSRMWQSQEAVIVFIKWLAPPSSAAPGA